MYSLILNYIFKLRNLKIFVIIITCFIQYSDIMALSPGINYGRGYQKEYDNDNSNPILNLGLEFVNAVGKSSIIGLEYNFIIPVIDNENYSESNEKRDNVSSCFLIIYKNYFGKSLPSKKTSRLFFPFIALNPSLLYSHHDTVLPGFEIQIGSDIRNNLYGRMMGQVQYLLSFLSQHENIITISLCNRLYYNTNTVIYEAGIKIYSVYNF